MSSKGKWTKKWGEHVEPSSCHWTKLLFGSNSIDSSDTDGYKILGADENVREDNCVGTESFPELIDRLYLVRKGSSCLIESGDGAYTSLSDSNGDYYGGYRIGAGRPFQLAKMLLVNLPIEYEFARRLPLCPDCSAGFRVRRWWWPDQILAKEL